MFTHVHYVPILRWKRAERVALRELREKDKRTITPLAEFIPRDFVSKPVEGVLFQKMTEIAENWGAAPIFVDLIHLPEKDPQLLDCFSKLSRRFRIRLIPVTGLTRSKNYQVAIASIAGADGRGACIRLRVRELRSPSLGQDLDVLLARLGLSPENVDLLLDYEVLANHSVDVASACALIPQLRSWRTFTVASGAFPKDLSDLEKNRQHAIPRRDWVQWQNAVRNGLSRLPAFSDYTIQHGVYHEPPGRANFSASIRYTAENAWVIMRGEGVFNEDGPGFDQWPAEAQLLCERPEYCGEDFSYGDRYIRKMSLQTKKTGSAETWLRAGVNHHITFVVRQIANLFGT